MKIQNGKVISGKSKIYGGTAPGDYKYIEGTSYTYYGESDIDRLSRWEIKEKYLVLWGYYIRNFLKHLLELDF